MATYKVPQNVEAEDKLIGPLSFKQFIFAIIASILGAATFFGFKASPFLGALFILPTLAFAILAFYRRPDQQVERYLAALFNFWFKPRRRTWDNDGISEHVIITAPKKVETHLDDDLNRSQVKSQLKQLAKVVDTRGWSSKHVGLNDQYDDADQNDDRLVSFDELRYAAGPLAGVTADDADDIMDEHANPVAQAFDVKSQQTVTDARLHALQTMQAVRQGSDTSQQSLPQ